MLTHRHRLDCTCCGAQGAVERPSALWKVALVAGYVLFGTMIFGASMLGLGVIGVIPFLALAGLGLLPFLHDRAGAQPTCSECGKINEGVARTPALTTRVEIAPARAT